MLPSGTRLVFSHGAVYDFYGIHNIDISPSLLDVGMTTGLCGRYNDNDEDDFIERGTGIIQQNAWHFAKSWKYVTIIINLQPHERLILKSFKLVN